MFNLLQSITLKEAYVLHFSRIILQYSALTVPRRIGEQKRHSTGLTSWDVIKEMEANVNIPVIANGNILSFDDVETCLVYTGADTVMSADIYFLSYLLLLKTHNLGTSLVDEKLPERVCPGGTVMLMKQPHPITNGRIPSPCEGLTLVIMSIFHGSELPYYSVSPVIQIHYKSCQDGDLT
ncbi:hypothetical protein AVEN_179387-1 [Araneus ventricosus]|uniref:DUS-like FMN-binding domain-containing protein n=1 Tax=Araneus ventricosus TaxID=182803 RepID=A0A4Y2BDW4_ARAVE|nr:hypothetical protein AVEN_179387-1 [Araneus ventricosus]